MDFWCRHARRWDSVAVDKTTSSKSPHLHLALVCQHRSWGALTRLRAKGAMAHLRRLGPQLVSPTPIRPHSPAGSPSRDRGETPPKKAAYLESDSPDCEDEAAGEMCQELLEIFQGSPRCAPPGPVDCGMVDLATVQPPSRNQNPLVKDQRFSTCLTLNDGHAFATSFGEALRGSGAPKSPPPKHSD